MNKSNLLDRGGLSLLQRSDPRSLVEKYLLAATMKDCSLMISVRLVTQQSQIINPEIVRVKGCDGLELLFAYSIRIVDLDPKSPKNLERAYTRFMAGVEHIKTNPNIHKPCNILSLINSA